MAKDVIGYIKCPDCGYEDAEVKETKKVFQGQNFVMTWCPHPKCQTQTFPRSADACKRIRAKMRPVTQAEPEPAPAPAADPAPPAAPKKKSLAEQFGI